MLTVSPNTDFEAVAQGFLTGLVGVLGYSIEDGEGGTVVEFTTAGIVETPEGSGVYTASVSGLPTVGSYVIVWDDGAGTTAAELLTVSNDAASFGSNDGLCTLAQVKVALEIPADDTSRDEAITAAILDASRAIMRDTKREFLDGGTATRSFAFPCGRTTLDFDPYDLRAVTSVVLHPGHDDEAEVTLSTDFIPLPLGGGEHGVYTRLRFGAVSRRGGYSRTFGFAEVAVTGTWGFAAVPEDVRRACIVTVSAWLEKGYAEQAADGWDEPRGTVPRPAPVFAIPGAAWRLLAPFARRQVY